MHYKITFTNSTNVSAHMKLCEALSTTRSSTSATLAVNVKAGQSMHLSQGKQGLYTSLPHGKHQRNMPGTSY